jgi:uncharacterized protein (TIGR00369 family)
MSQAKADLSYFNAGRVLPWKNKDFPFYEFMGLSEIIFLRVEDGLAEFKVPVTRNYLNIHMIVHGGVLATLADVGCAMAIRANMPIARLRKTLFYTQSLRLDYLANIRDGDLFVCGRVIRHLRNFSLVEVDIQNASGTLLARAIGQIVLSERRKKIQSG